MKNKILNLKDNLFNKNQVLKYILKMIILYFTIILHILLF